MLTAHHSTGQAYSEEDAFFIKKIYNTSLTQSKCYKWLHHLSEEIGGRLAGSPAGLEAEDYTAGKLNKLQVDTVFKQACEVKPWKRGNIEVVKMMVDGRSSTLNALSLGGSVGTGIGGIQAEVIEFRTLDSLEQHADAIKDKIVFFNRAMDPTAIRTFHAYGGAVDQRVWGASAAAKHGAKAVLIRSMTLKIDEVPHTGTMAYKEDSPKVPAFAISTKDAETMSDLLNKGNKVEAFLQSNCEQLETTQAHNVIAEIKGTEFPDKIILVGGHLDSWDVGGGAHDDGAGCVHAMQVIHTLNSLGYKPKHTIRCVLFANEENGLAGAKRYAKGSNAKKEFHLAAIESDAGGFTPRGFSCEADPSVMNDMYKNLSAWLPLLEPYGLSFTTGGSGADISQLKSQKGLLIGFRPDSQRYFDYHHAANDRINAVNKRELELGAASITALVYLIDKYGL